MNSISDDPDLVLDKFKVKINFLLMAKMCDSLVIDEDILKVTRSSIKKFEPTCHKMIKLFEICGDKPIKIIADDRFYQVYAPYLIKNETKFA